MARYRGREVSVVQELPNPTGNLVRIEHKELFSPPSEIVPRSQVWVSEDELASLQKTREETAKATNAVENNEFRVIGKDDEEVTRVPTAQEVVVQRMAEDNLIRAEEQAEENKEWQEQHPNLPATAKTQLDAIKVVPYRDETVRATDNKANTDKAKK